jgi:hypothetical protein
METLSRGNPLPHESNAYHVVVLGRRPSVLVLRRLRPDRVDAGQVAAANVEQA